MLLSHPLKHIATAAVLAACVIAVSNVQAAGSSQELAGSAIVALPDPVSAPCHISLHACAKLERHAALGGTVAAYPTDRWIEPVSAACHPALKRCRS